MTASFASPTEYAAAVRIALDVIGSADLPMELREQGVMEAGARLDCPPEERLARVVQLLSLTLAGVVAQQFGDDSPADALRRVLLAFEERALTTAA
ncbi:hypothetical protein [Nocardia brasiliensis]|jgi:hypothetical protein|uniref:hypothetical protein n=1 Tax=Nocardia brasiliensis TaxID=37326 RepID=UPI0033E6F246